VLLLALAAKVVVAGWQIANGWFFIKPLKPKRGPRAKSLKLINKKQPEREKLFGSMAGTASEQAVPMDRDSVYMFFQFRSFFANRLRFCRLFLLHLLVRCFTIVNYI